MNKEEKFFIYLLECYAYKKNRRTEDVLREWKKHNIVDYVKDNYLQYHTEPIENAYADIDSMIKTGKPAG